MTAIAIIPARGGSTRIPGKNWKVFHGRPIIQYSIETAQACGLFDRIIVSTDHPNIAEAADAAGAHVLWRPERLAVDQVGTQDVTRIALQAFTDVQYACCIYATAPLMLTEDLRNGLAMLRHNEVSHDFAMAVGAHPLRDAGQWYWGTAKAFDEQRPLISARTVMWPIPEERVCDINTSEDWTKAERMYEAMQSRDKP